MSNVRRHFHKSLHVTCLETYATIRVFSEHLKPGDIGRRLGMEETRSQTRDLESKYRSQRDWHFWAWSSRGLADTRDGLAHVREILSALNGKAAELEHLRSEGCEIDIVGYWVSSGQGGPLLEVSDLRNLAELGLPIWWDIYFGSAEEYTANTSKPSNGDA